MTHISEPISQLMESISMEKYRSYNISREWKGDQPDAVSFWHDDYDGAADAKDHRHGWARSEEEAKRRIDEIIAEEAFELLRAWLACMTTQGTFGWVIAAKKMTERTQEFLNKYNA